MDEQIEDEPHQPRALVRMNASQKVGGGGGENEAGQKGWVLRGCNIPLSASICFLTAVIRTSVLGYRLLPPWRSAQVRGAKKPRTESHGPT